MSSSAFQKYHWAPAPGIHLKEDYTRMNGQDPLPPVIGFQLYLPSGCVTVFVVSKIAYLKSRGVL